MRTKAEFCSQATDALADTLIRENVMVRWSGPRSLPFNVDRRVRTANDGVRFEWTIVLLEAGDASSYSEWIDLAPHAMGDPRVISYLELHGVKL